MFRPLPFSLAVLVLAWGASPASASVINVTPDNTTWSSSGNSGGGNSEIQSTNLLDGDGAIYIQGDRTRFNIENSNYGLLSSLNAFNFQWTVTQTGPPSRSPRHRHYGRSWLTR